MKELILKYLKTHYRIMPKTYDSYKVFDIMKNKEVSLKSVLKSLPKIFTHDETEIMSVFEAWSDEQQLNDYVIGPEFIPRTEEH